MASIFAKLGKTYGGNWEVVDSERFSEEDAKQFKSATVVDSDYGLSMCFVMTNGTQHFVPLSSNSSMTLGQQAKVSDLQILTLRRADEPTTIYRVEEV